MEYQFRRNSRRCHASGRELRPGEEYYSELIPLPAEDEKEFQRRDWSAGEWKGPDPEAIGWWHARIPLVAANRVFWAPATVLREYFRHLQESPDRPAHVWLMAMLLVRKRLLRLEREDEDAEGNRSMVLSDEDRQQFRVRVVEIAADEQESIQAEFEENLFTDQLIQEGDA